MPPLPHGVTNRRASFEHERLQAAFERMGGGRESHRPRADDGDRLWLVTHCFYPSRMME